MLFSRLGATLARAVVWRLRHDFERDLPSCKSLRRVARCARLHRRYRFERWIARGVDSDFRGLVKRGGIGIGFGRFFLGLDGRAGCIVGPVADKDRAA
jgi:hypothetical protein